MKVCDVKRVHNMVSVIVPCYNQARYLSEALQSVILQSYSNWECIIVNDGSTDNTENVALKFQEDDERFRYIKKENGGLSSARNHGLSVINGE
jgi:glycosyltransferase involved in cell wall biosynthesis